MSEQPCLGGLNGPDLPPAPVTDAWDQWALVCLRRVHPIVADWHERASVQRELKERLRCEIGAMLRRAYGMGQQGIDPGVSREEPSHE
jgi:hypothetical protein